jgi:hypothetical protein
LSEVRRRASRQFFCFFKTVFAVVESALNGHTYLQAATVDVMTGPV